MRVTGAVECPKCRTQHDLPPKGVEGFSTNFTITNLVELLNAHGDENSPTTKPVAVIKCKACEHVIGENPDAGKCLECNFYLCEECTIIHKKQWNTKHHKITPLAERGVKQLEQRNLCSVHKGEELKVYCRTCQEVICRDCIIVTHKQHDYALIKNVREELSKKLEDLMISVTKKEINLKSTLDCICQAIQEEQDKLASHQVKIRTFFDERVAKVQERIDTLMQHVSKLQECKTTLLADVDSASASHLKQLAAQEDELQFSCACLSSALTFSCQLLSSANTTDLAIMSKQVSSQLKAFTRLQVDNKPIDRSMWLLGLSEEDPLSSQVVPALADAIVVSKLANPALLGKNTFQISLKNIPATSNMDIDVKISKYSLSFDNFCPVRIQPSGPQSWSVSYFISPPCPNLVEVTVTVNGFQARDGSSWLHCRGSLASGTRVKSLRNQCVGTVADTILNVIWWDGGGHTPVSKVGLDNLQVLVE